ncbi:MAG: FAD-dependent monooxygenase, partial [Bdellovibrionales bacterium]
FDKKGIAYKNYAEPLGVDYKELLMPLDQDGLPALEKQALHIWPRGSHMLMALPNLDGSFTMTVYLPTEGEVSFSKIKTKDDVLKFAEKYYTSAVPRMPRLPEEWLENPVGALATVRCNNWVYKNKVALIGDAAHGIVPFFGQGMNCGFEDCATIDELYDEFNGDFEKIFARYNEMQVANGWAIADMAIENYTEMADKVGDDRFLLRKAVEHELENQFPNKYRARYGMVTYTLIPYALVQKAGLVQDKILTQLMDGMNRIDDLDLKKAEQLIDDQFVPFLKEHNISIERFK